MKIRLNLLPLFVVCLVSITGCVSSSAFRLVDKSTHEKIEGSWLLPPSAEFKKPSLYSDVKLNRFYVDLPLRNSSCGIFTKYPERLTKDKFQGQILPSFHGQKLRLWYLGHFLDTMNLRQKIRDWLLDKNNDLVSANCLGDSSLVIEQTLIERSPIQIASILTMHYGFDDQTRSVILHPGTNVCAADVPYRAISGTARFSAGGETCATATSDGYGGVVFAPPAIVLDKFSRLDTTKPEVHAIASWAEIPYLKGHQFLLRYPSSTIQWGMPTSPSQMNSATDSTFPLLIAFNTDSGDEVVERALQCVNVNANDDEIASFCRGAGEDPSKEKGFNSPSCKKSTDEGAVPFPPPICFRFGERGVLTPNITVQLNGLPLAVPLGTTLGGILERLTPPPFNREQLSDNRLMTDAGAHAILKNVRVKRIFESRPVIVDLTDAENSALNLPLLPGDQLSW